MPETFACARGRHVPPHRHPRQEAPQREYPPARGLRSLGPVGPRPAPSVDGGWCPRPRRPPPPHSSVSFPSRMGRAGGLRAGQGTSLRHGQIRFSFRMCGPFVLQQRGWKRLFPSPCSSPSLHLPAPFSCFIMGIQIVEAVLGIRVTDLFLRNMLLWDVGLFCFWQYFFSCLHLHSH